MKKALLLLLLFANIAAFAQNYQCLQPGVKHYFTNGNGYLRGIRIDSVRTIGDTTVYYPFHTPRGSYGDTPPYVLPILDSNSGSWLGKRVLQKSDGTFIFDSYWSDSVVIRTQAVAGDSWVLYSDTSILFYKATMLGTDTMSVLGSVDSVKKILITAQNPSGIVTTDPLDSFEILLSKNNGFVQVMDLYTFPYHKPDSLFRSGLDFYLDRSTNYSYGTSENGISPNHTVTIFKLVDYNCPNDEQLHNWNIGDIIQSRHQYGSMFPALTVEYISDTIVSKSVAAHSTTYVLNGLPYHCYCSAEHEITSDGTYVFYDSVYSVTSNILMPEESGNLKFYIYYFPSDTSYCINSPSFLQVVAAYNPWGLGWVIERTTYKPGIGKTNFYHFDGDPYSDIYDLVYTNFHDDSCGTRIPDKINQLNQPHIQFQIFPNPASGQLTIKTTLTTPYTITLQNMLGQTVHTMHTIKSQETINVSNLPAGVYNVSVTDDAGNGYNQKIILEH